MSYNLLNNRLNQLSRLSFCRYRIVNQYSSKSEDDKVEIPTNPLKNIYSASNQKENGHIYDKKPFKILCKKGKIYNWCLCGHSKRQPFCDGTHNNIFMKIQLKPVKFTVTETKEYWLCNCKQTTNRPFCDGTHKREDIAGKKIF